jgi:outer membrane murein-binding lipoprotein Lpp
MDKNALEQLLSSYNSWMGWSTVAVAVGILGEYVAHFVFEEDARRNRREMVVSILFGVLVLGGVVGEYLFGKKLSQVSEQLQQIADTQVAQVNSDAAAAVRDAEGLRLQIAQANERAANAERETARLTGVLADRTLSDEQVRSIAAKLSPYSGQVYDITPYRSSKESVGIAVRIDAALRLARWTPVQSQAIGLFGGIVGGLVFRHPDADQQTKAAESALVAALVHDGIQAELILQNSQNNPKHNKITLDVGAKR